MLEAARAEAREFARGIDKGDDPLEAKRSRREEPTVSELATDWLDRHASGLASEGAIRGYINNDLLPVHVPDVPPGQELIVMRRAMRPASTRRAGRPRLCRQKVSHGRSRMWFRIVSVGGRSCHAI